MAESPHADAGRDPRSSGEGDPTRFPGLAHPGQLVHALCVRSLGRWEFPGCPFERYADDIVAHCDTEEQAHNLRAAIAERFGALGLELHPEKTRIVYCKDANRRGTRSTPASTSSATPFGVVWPVADGGSS